MQRIYLSVAAAALASLLFVSIGRAQSSTGEITGIVLDRSGAAIQGATIVVTNTGTGVERRFQTDASGNYTVNQLIPGSYSIRAEKQGFESFVRDGVGLQIGQRLRVDMRMQVGSTTQQMTVTAQADVLEVEDASQGQAIENRKIVDMPLNGRNVVGLAALTAGVVPGAGFAMGIPDGRAALVQAATANMLINGGMSAENDVLIDGVPLALCCQNQISFLPSVDATQEFRVITTLYDAQYGRTSGGLVLFASKSGTNEFHGSAYEFIRNRVFDANNFFSNRAGVAKAHFVYNQFGGAIGGPIVRNRTFFFFNYEGIRNRRGSFLSGIVPTQDQRQGIFTTPIYDPMSVTQQGSNFIRTPFPNQTIPANRFDPVAVALTKLWPLPNTTGTNNFISNAVGTDNQDQYNIRIDHSIGTRNQLFGRLSIANNSGRLPDWFNDIASPGSWTQVTNDKNIVLEDTFTINPTMVLTVRYGFTRQADARNLFSTGVDLTQFGWPASYSDARQARVLPKINPSGFLSLSANGLFQRPQDMHALSASGSKAWGRHFLKFGFDGRMYQNNWSNNGDAAGTFSFNTGFTRGPNALNGGGGNSYASFLLGAPSSGDINIISPFAATEIYTGLYIQDDIHLSKTLTLNVGMRWDAEMPRYERYNRISYFDPTAASPIAGAVGIPGLQGGLQFPGVNGNPRTQQDIDWNNFGPRIGLAWNARSRLVFRAGYGIVYLPITTRFNSSSEQGFSATTPFLSSIDGVTPAGSLGNPFPDGVLSPTGSSLGLLTSLGQSFGTLLRDDPVAYSQEFSFNVQYELAKNLLLDAAYVGSKGTRLPVTIAMNNLPDNYLALGSSLLQTVANPFQPYVSTGTLAASTVTRLQLLKPFPQFLGLTNNTADIGSSIYHSFTLKLEKRFSHGFSALGAFTGGKLITDTTPSITSFLDAAPGFQDVNNRRLDRAIAPEDLSRRFVASFIVELPFGNGKKFLNGSSRALNLFVGGWQINGTTTYQTGQPIVIGNAVSTTSGATRPNNTGKSAKLSGPVEDRLNEYFDTSVFQAPDAFGFGSAPRTLPDVRADGLSNWDVSAFKNFTITEHRQLQFRAEFFNLFNSPQFAPPGNNGISSNFGNPDFGVVSVQRNDPRDVQFALKFLF